MQAVRAHDIPQEHARGQPEARPDERGIAAHVQEFAHRDSPVLSQPALRSRCRISARRRTSSTAPKNSVNASSITSKGQSMSPAIDGFAILVNVEGWCSVFHQYTE